MLMHFILLAVAICAPLPVCKKLIIEKTTSNLLVNVHNDAENVGMVKFASMPIEVNFTKFSHICHVYLFTVFVCMYAQFDTLSILM